MNRVSTKVRVPDLAVMKERGERIVMLTAYDASMARLLDRAGIDLLLVGDSLGNVILGLDTTIPVSLDAIVHHTRAVTQGASRALVVADMPFLTYQVSIEQAMRNAARHDVLGLFDEFAPKFVRHCAQLGQSILSATRAFANDVRQGTYPQPVAARHDRVPAEFLAESLAGSTELPREDTLAFRHRDPNSYPSTAGKSCG
jgi:ketopantoate hydroxymethyltransferase